MYFFDKDLVECSSFYSTNPRTCLIPYYSFEIYSYLIGILLYWYPQNKCVNNLVCNSQFFKLVNYLFQTESVSNVLPTIIITNLFIHNRIYFFFLPQEVTIKWQVYFLCHFWLKLDRIGFKWDHNYGWCYLIDASYGVHKKERGFYLIKSA